MSEAAANAAVAAAAQAKAYRDALIETWTLYAVGTIIICLRAFTRTKLVGIRGYRLDDYLVWLGWAAYTGMTVAAHIVGGTGDTSHIPLEDRLAMTPEQRQARSQGSKWFMVGWYTYITLIWTLKFNMLCLYDRVVRGSWVEKFIRPAQGFIILTAISIYVLFATGCRPFHKLWQVLPDPGPYCCPQSPAFLITVLVLNLTTDCLLLAIPLPVIVPLKTSTARKIGLCLLFSGAIFTMIAAILRVWYVLALQQGQAAAIWSCREDVIAILVGQATMIKPILSKRFWNGDGSKTKSSNSYPSKPSHGTGSEGHELSQQSRNMASRLGLKRAKDPYNVSVLETKNESEERIVSENDHGTAAVELKSAQQKEHSYSTRGTSTDGENNTIHVSTTIQVDVESLGDAPYAADQKPNYGHNSRVHSKWNAF